MEHRKDLHKYTRLTAVDVGRAKRSEALGSTRAEARMKLLQDRRGNIEPDLQIPGNILFIQYHV